MKTMIAVAVMMMTAATAIAGEPEGVIRCEYKNASTSVISEGKITAASVGVLKNYISAMPGLSIVECASATTGKTQYYVQNGAFVDRPQNWPKMLIP